MSDTQPTANTKPSDYTETQQQILAYARTMQTPLIVKGTAGSGKSFITSKIAEIFLNTPAESEPNCIGIVTFTNKLINDLQGKIGSREGLKIFTAHETLNQFLEANGQPRITHFDEKNTVLDSLQNTGALERYPKDFLSSEFNWINQKKITSLEEYKNTPRTPDASFPYDDVWNLYCEHKKRLREKGLYLYSELPNLCLDYMEKNPAYTRIRTHLIIDEFQDLGRNVIEALIKICRDPNRIVFVGDLAQSIYKNALSWKEFDTASKQVFELTDNLRNTRQIARAAESLLDNEYKLNRYDRQDYTEMISMGATGAKPVIAICRNVDEQRWYIANELARINKNESVALICRGKRGFQHCYGVDPSGEKQIQKLTMHSCKGLEFDNVFILDANEGVLPNRYALLTNPQETLANERRLLYVAMTRARKRLFIVTSAAPSRFLAEIHPAAISPVALDNESYEKLYNNRFDELLQQREKIVQELNELKKQVATLQSANQLQQERISLLERSKEFVEGSIDSLTDKDLHFRASAKILIIGGDGGLSNKDVAYTLKNCGLDKDSYELVRYDELKNFGARLHNDLGRYCDVIIGCCPHKIVGVDNLIAELEQNKDFYKPKIEILKDPDGKPSQLTKTNLKKAISKSYKYRLMGLNKKTE